MNRKTHVLGVPFDVVTMDEAVARAEGLLKEKGQHFICTPNPEIVMEARKDAELMSILREADLVVPDGIGVVWASKYSEIRLQERVAGYDLTQNLMADLAASEETFYFFGGAPGVAATAARKMMKKYPGLKIVGVHNGYFDEKEEKKIIQDIKKKAPSILLVGLGAPKQEKWIYSNWQKLNIHCHVGTIGAVFDFFAGTVERAPIWWQEHGLEWAYRLLKEPKRMWRRYIIGNSLFLWNILKEKIAIID